MAMGDLGVAEICRCCLLASSTDTDFVSMRVAHFVYKDEKVQFYDSFIRCCGSIYKYLDGIDNQDPKICKFCRIQLESAYIFLDLITEANSILTNHLQQGKAKAVTPTRRLRQRVETPEVNEIAHKEVVAKNSANQHGNYGKNLGMKFNQCKLCNKRYKSKKRHNMVNHPQKPNVFKCELGCSSIYNTALSLNNHLQRMHACPVTGCFALRSIKDLKVHMKQEHGDRPDVSKTPTPIQDEASDTSAANSEVKDGDNLSFRCELCDCKFRTNKGLKIHMFVKHDTKIDVDTTGPNTRFSCKICSLVFKTDKGLKIHNYHRHRPRKGRQPTLTKPASTNVQKKKIPDSSIFRCPYCPAVFDTQRGGRVHALRMHNATRVVAQKLKKRVINKMNMQPKQFKCSDCDKQFKTYAQMHYHRYEHRGHPFQCMLCSQGISKKVHFLIHLTGKHNVNIDSNPDAHETYNARLKK